MRMRNSASIDSLALFPDDIVFSITANLPPRDLLALSRTCRRFRRIFLAPDLISHLLPFLGSSNWLRTHLAETNLWKQFFFREFISSPHHTENPYCFQFSRIHGDELLGNHISLDPAQHRITYPEESPPRHFPADRCFGPDASQVEVYRTLGTYILDQVLNRGKRVVTVVLDGEHGAGKMYTAIGPYARTQVLDERSAGLVPRLLRDLLASGQVHDLRAQMLSIHREQLYDRLGQPNNARIIRQSREPLGTYIPDLTTCPVRTLADYYALQDRYLDTACGYSRSRSDQFHIFRFLFLRPDGPEWPKKETLGPGPGSGSPCLLYPPTHHVVQFVIMQSPVDFTTFSTIPRQAARQSMQLCLHAIMLGRKYIPVRDTKVTRLLGRPLNALGLRVQEHLPKPLFHQTEAFQPADSGYYLWVWGACLHSQRDMQHARNAVSQAWRVRTLRSMLDEALGKRKEPLGGEDNPSNE